MKATVRKAALTTNGSQPAKLQNGLLQAYFPGLNELRALAALAVILSHIEQMKELADLPFKYWFPIPGKLGVILFFVLSGFLITSLLLQEKTASSGFIDLRRFYLKRVLRIWPLYFFVVGASLLVLNRLSPFEVPGLTALAYSRLDWKNILLLLCILPNYVEILIPYLTQIWSIGIEEQFYLFQPCIIKYLRSDAALAVATTAILFLKEILLLVNRFAELPLLHEIANQSVYTGCIAIGCLCALLCRNFPDWISRIIHHRLTQSLAMLLFVALLALISIY
ncbi:MAG: acyltransferase, partial [Geobacter sp.]|nr:acyltransferase [Geobacter sp.]